MSDSRRRAYVVRAPSPRASPRGSRESRENLFHDVPVNVSQPEIAPLEAIRQSLVVDPQAVEQRRVEVVNVNGLIDDVVAEVVGFAVDDARLYAAAGQPHREIARVMVASVILFRQRALAVDRAAE